MINVVCAVIENSEKEFLVCQRPAGKPLAGKWEFPGGKVEPGESEIEAIERELREELGCASKVGSALTVVEHQDIGSSIRLIPFLCKLEGAPQLREHAQLLWCRAKNFADLDWAAADIPVWRELLEKEG